MSVATAGKESDDGSGGIVAAESALGAGANPPGDLVGHINALLLGHAVARLLGNLDRDLLGDLLALLPRNAHALLVGHLLVDSSALLPGNLGAPGD